MRNAHNSAFDNHSAVLSIPSLGTEVGVLDIMEFHMASFLPPITDGAGSFQTEFSFALLEDNSIIMHATIKADRDLHAGIFEDVPDTSMLPKVNTKQQLRCHWGVPWGQNPF